MIIRILCNISMIHDYSIYLTTVNPKAIIKQNPIPNSSRSAMNTLSKLILQKNQRMIPLTIMLEKSTRKNRVMLPRVSQISSIAT